jgi:hypothetical protein
MLGKRTYGRRKANTTALPLSSCTSGSRSPSLMLMALIPAGRRDANKHLKQGFSAHALLGGDIRNVLSGVRGRAGRAR